MTLALVAACKDSFYLMADTRTQNTTNNTVSDTTQKVFYSNKHKLGLCIADDAMLPVSSNLNQMVSVSHIMNEFFKDIEARDIQTIKNKINSIDNFFAYIHKFIKINFGPQALAQFENHVSVFLAAIINNVTVIGSFIGDKNSQVNIVDTFDYSTNLSNKLCVFSNYQILIDKYSKDAIDQLGCPYTGNEIEKQNQLFGDHTNTTRKYVFDKVVDGARLAVLQQYPDSIGEYFQYIRIGQNDTDFRNVKLKVSGNEFVSIDTSKGEYFPNLVI